MIDKYYTNLVGKWGRHPEWEDHPVILESIVENYTTGEIEGTFSFPKGCAQWFRVAPFVPFVNFPTWKEMCEMSV